MRTVVDVKLGREITTPGIPYARKTANAGRGMPGVVRRETVNNNCMSKAPLPPKGTTGTVKNGVGTPDKCFGGKNRVKSFRDRISS